MKKFLFVLLGVFVVIGAFAAGENTPTSKSYVDAAVTQKQDKISAIMPAEYTQLEYIESTGTQYIDTGQKFMHDDEFYFEYMPMASYSDENKGYGAGASLGVNITGGGRNSGSRVCMYGFGGNLCYEPQLPYNYTLGRRYIENWTLKSGVFHSVLTDVNDGSTYRTSKGSISQSYDSGNSVYLWRDNSYQHSYPSKSRIYRTWLKRADGTMAFDLFPARRDSDGVLGMYDTVSNTFFTNNGTGEFIAGPVIIPDIQVLTNTGTVGEYGTKGIYDATGEYATQQNNLVDAVTMNTAVQNAIDSEFQCIEWLDPNDHTSECLLFNIFGPSPQQTIPREYTQLECIESTGTQYIDTLVTLGVDFEIYLDAMVSSRADHILLAGGLDVQKYSASLFSSGINGNWGDGGIEFGGDNNRFYIGISPFWIMHYNGVKKVVVRRYSPSGTLRVFSGTVGRLYNLKIYSGPLLQFNGIPARRNSDNVVGMYDTISGRFFTSSGTDGFIAGPVANMYLPAGN